MSDDAWEGKFLPAWNQSPQNYTAKSQMGHIQECSYTPPIFPYRVTQRVDFSTVTGFTNME
jgi:hypothetical protein